MNDTLKRILGGEMIMKATASLLGKLELRVLPLESLKPAPYNPRQRLKPGSPAYRKLETSLREFGLVEPLIWNETTGFVVGGHARLEILRARRVEEVPVSVALLDPAARRGL